MATFGKGAPIGGSTDYTDANYVFASKYTLGENGTATSMTVYLKCFNAGIKYRLGLYKTDLSYVDRTDEFSPPAVDDWYTANFPAGVPLIAGYYWLYLTRDSALANNRCLYDAGGANTGFYGADAYNGQDDPATPDAYSTRNRSIYCTYTPTAGLSIPVAMHHYGHHISKIIRG